MLERMARRSQTGRHSFARIALALLAVGCSREPAKEPAGANPSGVTPQTAVSIYERAGRTFDTVQLNRSRPNEELPFDVYLAPMIVQELGPATTAVSSFGALALAESGHAEVRAESPAVYFARSQASIGGEQRDQLAFLWWYPDAPQGNHSAQGVRITLGKTGVPIVWEVLSDPSGARLVFVSETLEELARQHNGPALPGRRFSVERSFQEAPRAVVARAISNGGVPLGPFVYLEAGTHAARTLLCRCSPSEFTDIAGEILFELRSLASLAELGLEKRDWTAALPVLAGSPLPEQPDDADPHWLEQNLRLPPGL
jgi:hypothetical protein